MKIVPQTFVLCSVSVLLSSNVKDLLPWYLIMNISHHLESRKYNYIPRLFELTSSTGEFVATEVIYPARSSETVAYPFLQSDIYNAVQPGITCTALVADKFICLCTVNLVLRLLLYMFPVWLTTCSYWMHEHTTRPHTHTCICMHKLTHTHIHTIKPAIFLVDALYEVYLWLGWWPQVQNKLLREANATTGSAHSKWFRDKKLALETVELYIKGLYL